MFASMQTPSRSTVYFGPAKPGINVPGMGRFLRPRPPKKSESTAGNGSAKKDKPKLKGEDDVMSDSEEEEEERRRILFPPEGRSVFTA